MTRLRAFTLLGVVGLMLTLPTLATAALRDGIDCECSRTGGYVKVSKGVKAKLLADLVDPSVVVVSPNEGMSPNDNYRITQSSFGSNPTQTILTITATGSSTTLLQIQFIATGSEGWGFSPDDDRFIFNYSNGTGSQHIELFDLTSLSNTSGPPAYETDIDGVWGVLFAPKGGRLVLTSEGGIGGKVFRIVDPTTGDLVFTQGTSGVSDSAADFDFQTTVWGFSPDGDYLIFHYLSAVTGAQRLYVRGYDLAPPTATQTLTYDHPAGTAELRFSSNSDYLLDAYSTGLNDTSLQVRETATGALIYDDSFTFTNNPGNEGDKFKGAGWGFSPRAGNLIYAVDKGPSAIDLHLVNLDTGEQVLLASAPDVTSGFWEFSPCGDVLATVLQNGSGQLVGKLYSSLDGSDLLYDGSSLLTVLWQFQSTSPEHQVSVDGGPWQMAATNEASGTCTPPVPDTTPPVWDPGASLTATAGTGQGEVDLAWAPAATDADSNVALYAIYQDGGEVATVPADTLAYTVGGLTSSASLTFKVEAEDDAPSPNRSEDGPSAAITLSDWEAPSWGPADALVANNLGPTSLDLAWPAASDDTAVTEYRVYRGNDLYTTLAGDATGFGFTGLDWESDYHFEVEAADALGHVSARLLLDVTTAGPPASAQPPVWPGAASLGVSVTGPETVDLSWPAASGADGVGAYDVYLNGRRVAQVAGDQTAFSFSGLLPDMDWAFEVVPRNVWRQPGLALAGAGRTAPGTHVDPPIPTTGVRGDNNSRRISRISGDGRYASIRGSATYLYDRLTGESTAIEDSLLSGDGRHVIYRDALIENSVWTISSFLSRDLDSLVDTLLYDVDWGAEPAGPGYPPIAHDVSDAGDRLLIEVTSPKPGDSGLMETHLLLADGSQSTLTRVARVGSLCVNISDPCSAFHGALLSPDGESVIYWGSTRVTGTIIWIRQFTRSRGSTRTLLELSHLGNEGPGRGSADDSGLVVFETTDSLLPADTPRSGGPVSPSDSDIYALDRVTGALELVSVDAGGAAVGGAAPSVSADGRFVAFEGGTCGQYQVAVRDRWLASTRCMPLDPYSAEKPVLSGNGRFMFTQGESASTLLDLAWQPPSWPSDAAIVMTGHDFTSIDFTWTPVEDPAQFPAVAGSYIIYQDGTEVDSIPVTDFAPGTPPSYGATGLRPGRTYTFGVELLDATDTETTDGPQAALSTPLPSSDLSLSIVDSPDPIGTATQVRYDITLSNAGPDTAFDAAFDFSWPVGFGFLAANPMAGSCVLTAPDSLSCVVGDIPTGGSVQVVVLLSTGAQGTADVSASANALGTDPVPENSTAVQESTEVVLALGGRGGGFAGAGMVDGGPLSAGSVIAWGDSANGKTNPPASVAQRTVRAVAAGPTHSCAIQVETGAVVCWGSDSYGESTPPASVDGTQGTAVAIAAGNRFTCAIQSGTQAVVCWGNDGSGKATPDSSVDGSSGGATAVAAGWNHACAIRADTGAVVCWGTDANRQRTVPSSVNGVEGTASAIAVGYYHSCAIQAGTGDVFCWGAVGADYGQLAVPPAVDGTSGTAIALEAGQRDTCAIQTGTDAVVCWGANLYGVSSPPSIVDGSAGGASALAIADAACAIQAGTHAVVCWGDRATAPLSQVDGRAGSALAISARQSHFCAIQAGTRAAVCWGGYNFSGETSVPASADGSGGLATAVAAGAGHSCAIEAGSRAVVCWGDDDQLQSSVPPDVDGSEGTASAIATGADHSCAIQAQSDVVVCWGANSSLQSAPPAEVNGSSGTAWWIAGGWDHSCAIQDETDAVVCWGDDSFDQSSVPSAVDGNEGTASALATGTFHSCAIQAQSGAVACWGDDSAGKATAPAAVNGTDGSASAIAAGDSHSCAIQEGTGAVVCWGDDAFGASTPPAGVDGVGGRAVAIAAGDAYSCAVQAGSLAVLCWGDDTLGRSNPPDELDGERGAALGLATGSAHGLALFVPEPDARLLGLAALLTLLLLRRAPHSTLVRDEGSRSVRR